MAIDHAARVLDIGRSLDVVNRHEHVADILLSTAARENKPVAEALGDAQRSLYEQPETAHPFFWSGFVLIGDGGAVLTAPTARTAAR